jgi:hypothetical protein
MNGLVWLLVAGALGVARAGIRINEVCYDPAGADAAQEWVELINTGPEPQSLAGWLLDCNGPNLLLPPVEVGPGQVFLIHNNAVAEQPPAGMEAWYVATSLGNTHGFLGLWNSESQVVESLVDYMEYGAAGHSWEGQAVSGGFWPLGAFLPDVEQGHSLHYLGTGGGPGAWRDDADPQPGEELTVLAQPDPGLPAGPQLLGAWPNPFNPATIVSFRLAEVGEVRLSLLDLLGRRVAVLAEGRLGPGLHQRTLAMEAQPAGPYFLKLEAGGEAQVRKILLIK